MKKKKVKDIGYFIQGWVRYGMYYNKRLRFFMRRHILEQIDYRIGKMNKECYTSGSCVECGCKTTALQMANKPCDGDCYISMQSRKNWKKLKGNI